MFKQKGFITSLIIIILAAAALIGGYLVYQKQAKPAPLPQQIIQPSSTPHEPTSSAQTANWKTYTNIKYGYAINYPPEFNLSGNRDSDYISFNNQINILVEPVEKTSCLGDCPTEKLISTENVKIGELNTLKINGIKEISRVAGYSPPESFVRYEIVHKNYKYILEVEELDDNKSYENEEKYPPDRTPSAVPNNILTAFNQILSTFKFLPTNWKTFSFDDTGLELKYPPNWKIKTVSLANIQQVSLYPPESDPQLPSKNITFSLSDAPYEPIPTPAEYMSQYKPIVIAGITGRISEYLPPKEGELRLPLVGGECQEPVVIALPVINKMLFISSCKDLELNLKDILKTVAIL